MDIITYALCKSYVKKTANTLGAVKGSPCVIKSQTEDKDFIYVTFGWTGTDGSEEETKIKIKKGTDGVNGAPGDKGDKGDPGKDGVGISKVEKIKTKGLEDTYQITFTDNTTFEYVITNGADGQGGGTSGGTTNYTELKEKPMIEGITLIGNKELKDFGAVSTEDLLEYVTKTELDEKGYLTEHQSLEEYAKKTEIPSLIGYATEKWVQDKGYLTEHQDISGLVEKEEGKSLIADTEIERLKTVTNYDDTKVKEDIKGVSDKVAGIESNYATKTYVGEQIAAADHLKREIVTEVPSAEAAAENVIYMLKVESAIGADKYKEYMLIDKEIACIGDTSVDLTDYAKKTDLPDVSIYVEKEEGKGLSTNDFSTEEKEKLEALENYDDSGLATRVNTIETTYIKKSDLPAFETEDIDFTADWVSN